LLFKNNGIEQIGEIKRNINPVVLDDEDIEKYKNNEITVLDLEEKYNFERKRISEYLTRHKIKKKFFKFEDITNKDLEDLKSGKINAKKIAEKYKANQTTLYRILNENGIYLKRGRRYGN
jgi:hypothetical protein